MKLHIMQSTCVHSHSLPVIYGMLKTPLQINYTMSLTLYEWSNPRLVDRNGCSVTYCLFVMVEVWRDWLAQKVHYCLQSVGHMMTSGKAVVEHHIPAVSSNRKWNCFLFRVWRHSHPVWNGMHNMWLPGYNNIVTHCLLIMVWKVIELGKVVLTLCLM